MTAADLPFLVAAAPGTAVLSAFVVGGLCAFTTVGVLRLFRHLAAGDGHTQRCASCAEDRLLDVADAVGVSVGE